MTTIVQDCEEEDSVRVRVVPVAHAELHLRHHGQLEVQRCVVSLNTQTGTLTAAARHDDSHSREEHGGLVVLSSIPPLRGDVANQLLEKIKPLCQRIVNGTERVWDRRKIAAKYSKDAEEALEELHSICDTVDKEGALKVWTASNWYGPIGDGDAQRAQLDITRKTTLDELQALVAKDIQPGEVDVIEGALDYLVRLRDGAPKGARKDKKK